jgi:hypothetical protein
MPEPTSSSEIAATELTDKKITQMVKTDSNLVFSANKPDLQSLATE